MLGALCQEWGTKAKCVYLITNHCITLSCPPSPDHPSQLIWTSPCGALTSHFSLDLPTAKATKEPYGSSTHTAD